MGKQPPWRHTHQHLQGMNTKDFQMFAGHCNLLSSLVLSSEKLREIALTHTVTVMEGPTIFTSKACVVIRPSTGSAWVRTLLEQDKAWERQAQDGWQDRLPKWCHHSSYNENDKDWIPMSTKLNPTPLKSFIWNHLHLGDFMPLKSWRVWGESLGFSQKNRATPCLPRIHLGDIDVGGTFNIQHPIGP